MDVSGRQQPSAMKLAARMGTKLARNGRNFEKSARYSI